MMLTVILIGIWMILGLFKKAPQAQPQQPTEIEFKTRSRFPKRELDEVLKLKEVRRKEMQAERGEPVSYTVPLKEWIKYMKEEQEFRQRMGLQ